MKIRIIDLLNMINKGEEVPKKIKYEKHIYEYEEGTHDWSYYIQDNATIKFLLTDVFNSDDNILSILNDEVEIIEENKNIEKIKLTNGGLTFHYGENNDVSITIFERTVAYKINGLIDAVNKLKGGDNK